jgi:ELWxxDGT repeat protein
MCSFRLLLSLALAAVLAAPLAAQTASIVKDINSNGPNLGTGFHQLTPAGNQLFFLGDDLGVGGSKNLWVSGGTGETTHIVRDFCPGDCIPVVDLVGSYRDLALVSVNLLGIASPALLWRSDGTAAGTFPLSTTVTLRDPVPFQGAVYLSGCTRDLGCDLWKTDGSTLGTVPVKDLVATGGSLQQALAAGHRLFFTVGDRQGGVALWSSDGTAAGSAQIQSLGHGGTRLLAAAGDRLFFTLAGDDQVPALWTSDGTPAGTRALHTFSQVLSDEGIRVLGGRVYFAARDAVYGREVWTSDGTPAGTRRITAFESDEVLIQELRVAGNRIVFLASNNGHGAQIWSTLGTLESTAAVPNPPCRECSFLQQNTPLVELGGRLFFRGTDDAHGAEPWVTDGTAAGTHLLADLCTGPCSSVNPYGEGLPATPQGALFLATDPVHGLELWRTDGTSAGTVRLTDIAAPHPSFSNEAVAMGGKLYFSVIDATGPALWVSERPRSAHPVALIAPQGPASDPRELTPLGDSLLFTAWDGATTELWRTDGTEAGTTPLGAQVDHDLAAQLTPAGGLVFFLAWDAGEGTLWRTDGTPTGTFPLLYPVQGGLTAYRGKLYFRFRGNSDPVQSIWSSDGTIAGTLKEFDLPAIPRVTKLTGLGSDLYFLASGEPIEGQIWHSDGTAAGTQKIATLNFYHLDDYDPHFNRLGSRVLFTADTVWATDGTPGGTAPLFSVDAALGRSSSDLTVFQDAAYFVASATAGTGLWRSDGTPGGTLLVKEIAVQQGIVLTPRSNLVTGAGKLWLIADDGIHGDELWTSDGTAAGTSLLRDLNPGPAGSSLSALTAVGDRMFFTASDGTHGLELWQSDGTGAGTRMVQDIAPLGLSSKPSYLTALGDQLYFSANDGPTGRELWSLPLSGPGGCQPSGTALCLGGRYRVEARWRDFAGNAGEGHAVPLTAKPGTTGTFWFFDPANVEAIVKILDGNAVNGHVWVFYGALSNVEYTLTVTDTQTGLTRQYFNPSGQLASVGDVYGFGPLGANGASPKPPLSIAVPSPPPWIAERRNKTASVPCQPGAQRLCLNGSRFAVEVAWKDFQGHTGQGTAVPLSGDTGTFWFFDAANVELVVKALDGRPVNGHFWLFYGALSNVEYTVTVTDSQTGTKRTYTNPSGRFASVADTTAF